MQQKRVLDSVYGRYGMNSLSQLNITISNMSISPSSVTPGQSFHVYYTVNNASGSTQMVYGQIVNNSTGQVITSPPTFWSQSILNNNSVIVDTFFSAGIQTSLSASIQVGHVEYIISTSANPSSGGTVTVNTAGSTYYPGQTINITALAGAGYQFSSWSGGTVSGSSSSTSFIMPMNDVSIVANFTTVTTCTSYTTQVTCNSAGCYWWNSSCHATAPTCTDLNTQAECNAYGCYWWGGACHSTPQTTCESYTTQATCISSGCYWYNNSCHSSPQPTCESYTTQALCSAAGCYWYNNSCHSTPQTTCSSYTTPTTCVNGGCYWWTSDNSCHDSPEGLTCSSYTTPNTCITNGCYWWISDNKCHSTIEPTACSIYNGDPDGCVANGCIYDWDTNQCIASQPIWKQPWFIPVAVVGTGGIIGLAILLTRKK